MAIQMKDVSPIDLEVDQIRSLGLLDNITMVRLLSAPFRTDVKISDEEIYVAWDHAVGKAQAILGVNLVVSTTEAVELRNILFQLLAKEFPYAGN